jgi:putative ABC transport system permease protein
MLIDVHSKGETGPTAVGLVTEIHGRRVTAVGECRIGPGALGSGLVVVGPHTFLKLAPGAVRDRIQLGLIRLRPGLDPAAAAARLRGQLGADVRVLTRAEVEEIDQGNFLERRPVGILFRIGVALSFLVGSVTLYHILAVETSNRRGEYATLLALGHTRRALVGVVVQMGLLYVSLSFLPALLLATGLLQLVGRVARAPALLEVRHVLLVGGLCVVMCATASVLAMRKLRAANPAELFG